MVPDELYWRSESAVWRINNCGIPARHFRAYSLDPSSCGQKGLRSRLVGLAWRIVWAPEWLKKRPVNKWPCSVAPTTLLVVASIGERKETLLNCTQLTKNYSVVSSPTSIWHCSSTCGTMVLSNHVKKRLVFSTCWIEQNAIAMYGKTAIYTRTWCFKSIPHNTANDIVCMYMLYTQV